jgi:hypothetical protein
LASRCKAPGLASGNISIFCRLVGYKRSENLAFSLTNKSTVLVSIKYQSQMILLGIIWLAGEISQREALLRYYMVHPVYIYTFLTLAGFLAFSVTVVQLEAES